MRIWGSFKSVEVEALLQRRWEDLQHSNKSICAQTNCFKLKTYCTRYLQRLTDWKPSQMFSPVYDSRGGQDSRHDYTKLVTRAEEVGDTSRY